jgi:hypothetical protein
MSNAQMSQLNKSLNQYNRGRYESAMPSLKTVLLETKKKKQ